MKTGLIDVGGGSRDIYGAGVLDFCLDHGITFDYCIGISAGSANLASFLAGQRGRNYVFYTDYFFRKEYASLHNMLVKRNYVDLDYVYDTLSNSEGEYPLDFRAMYENPTRFLVEACDANTGEAVYFDKQDLRPGQTDIFKASSCLPLVCTPCPVDGRECFDGGLADPIPLQKAFDDGCDRVIVILTRPKNQNRVPGKDQRCARLIRHQYPATAQALETRAARYNEQLRIAKEYEAAGKVLILAPDDIMGMKTLTKDKEKLEKLYQKGLADGEKILSF